MTAARPNTPIAIIGLGAVMPDANDLASFWHNICTGKYSIREVPRDRWLPEDHYDPDPKAPDRSYAKIGAFVRGFDFDSLSYRIPPRVAESMDNVQKWAVDASRQALSDAGYDKKDFDRNRTAVVIGNAMAGEMQYTTNLRVYFPRYARSLRSSHTFEALPADIRERIVDEFHSLFTDGLPPITEDSMPGELSNVIAGRVANVFGLRGPNYTADAACASSLAALEAAINGLAELRYDMVLTGGTDSSMAPHSFVKFSKVGALSAKLSCPFDKRADGFVMGEGCGMLLLKRLVDAELDGDKIYAVLHGLGSSSDGKGKGITAPNPAGQMLALERAYENSGISPADVTMLEAHGTSTIAGDRAEGNLAAEFYGRSGAARHSIAMGSVKSQIGHLKSAAGAAALIKTALSIHQGVIPGSLNFEQPNPEIPFDSAPVFVPTETNKWKVAGGKPRLAGLSAFGFGGTNFHAVLGEYRPAQRPRVFPAGNGGQGSEDNASRKMLALGAADPQSLKCSLEKALSLPRGKDAQQASMEVLAAKERIVIEHGCEEERTKRGRRALAAMEGDNPAAWRALAGQGIFRGSGHEAKVAFIFPGQGSQYIGMFKELRGQEPVVEETFREADRIMEPILGKPLSAFINAEDTPATREALRDTNVCQPAMLAGDVALARLFEQHGIRPDMVAGHSLGEYAALVMSGMLSYPEALRAVSSRAREMSSVKVDDPGKMAAALASFDEILAALDGLEGIVPANMNSHRQTVIAGASAPFDEAMSRLKQAGIRAIQLPVSHAFHSYIVAPAMKPLRKMLAKFDFHPPRIPLVANVDAQPYDPDPAAMSDNLDRLARQIASPVRWVESVEKMYELGARVFVEIGAKRVLANLTFDILTDPGVVSVSSNNPKLGDRTSFNLAMAALAAAGRPLPEFEENIIRTSTTENAMPTDNTSITTSAEAGPEIVISGASLGLPGVNHPVFDENNTERILEGQTCIDPVPLDDRRKMAGQRIVRLVKNAPGGPVFTVIESPDQVARLTGRKGPFDLAEEFGLDPKRVESYDITTRLAIAAGLLALRDAGIPLVMHHRQTSTGSRLPIGYRLPDELASQTGIIFASAFPGYDQLVQQMNLRQRDELYQARIAELKLLAEDVGSLHAVTRRIEQLEQERGERYGLDRKFIFQALAFGHAQMAELIGARGPNIQVNGACSSTTQAVAIASDWIRLGRCRRVLVVGADDITNSNLAPWLVGGLLATGAVTNEARLENAALPFDRRRNGMIPGMGAVGMVVEDSTECRRRGVAGLTRLLGTAVVNSAFHGTRLNIEHISETMDAFIGRMEHEHGLDRHQIASQTVFVSHETYTPARGGSASAEVHALRHTFGQDAEKLVIANTKGFTGHPMGVGIEDVVAVRMLERQIVPPIPNYKEVDPELGTLNLSRGGHHDVRYALRLAAGFGSQLAISLMERVSGNGERINQAEQLAWTQDVTGIAGPELETVNKTLRVKDTTDYTRAAAARTVSAAAEPEPEAKPVEPTEVVNPPAQALDAATIEKRILSIVAEKTGYPVEMLELDLDLEADLGIDTVKQAETFSEVRAAFSIPKQDDMKLSDYPTLGHIIRFAMQKSGAAAAAEPVPEAVGAHRDAPLHAAPEQPPANTPAFDTAKVEKRILEIVAEKTGYPVEMLELDLDLEADLGIDTVKQAETFSEVRAAFDIPKQDDMKLSDYPTLGHIVRFAMQRAGGTSAAKPTANATTTKDDQAEEASQDNQPEPLTSIAAESETVRFLAPVLVGRPRARECLPTGVDLACRSFIIGGDEGVANTLAAAIRAKGGQPVIIAASADPDSVAHQVERLASENPPRGAWLLTALGDPVLPGGDDQEAWQRAVDSRARLPFRVAKALNEALSNTAGSFFVAATRMGGHLGLRPGGGSLDPVAGATCGLVKSLDREWQETLCKVVDLPAEADADYTAATLIEEAEVDRGVCEVGRAGIRRWGVGLGEYTPCAEEEAQAGAGCLPAADPVVLVTGGAGDITGRIALDLAGNLGGSYYLLDLAPEPDQNDTDIKLLGSDRESLKKAILERLRGQEARVTPVMVERELRGVERRAAALESLRAIRATGAEANYISLDITDTAAVKQAVGQIVERHGRLDLALHAAGLEHSQGIASKKPEAFDTIMGVKVNGLQALLSATRDVELKGLMLFGSVAGRFGNAGQTDYAAANDLLAKCTTWLKAARPGLQVFTLAFSGWDGRGMATRGSVPEQLAGAGITLIPLEQGASSVRRVLASGFSGELVVARSLGVLYESLRREGVDLDLLRGRLSKTPERFPLLGDVLDWTQTDGLRLRVSFDPASDGFLNDHRIDGVAVLPGVMAVETFAEAAILMRPDLTVVAIEDLAFEAPLKLYRDQERSAVVRLIPTWDKNGRVILATMETERELAGGLRQRIRHFKARLHLDQDLPLVRSDPPPNGRGPAIDKEAIYRAYFHGPSFQVLERVTTESDGRMAGWMSPGTELPPLRRPGKLAAQPMFTELAFQAAGMVEMQKNNKQGLPSGVRRLRLHRTPDCADTKHQVAAWVIPHGSNGETQYGIKVIDDRGYVLLELDGYRTSTLPNSLPDSVRAGLEPREQK